MPPDKPGRTPEEEAAWRLEGLRAWGRYRHGVIAQVAARIAERERVAAEAEAREAERTRDTPGGDALFRQKQVAREAYRRQHGKEPPLTDEFWGPAPYPAGQRRRDGLLRHVAALLRNPMPGSDAPPPRVRG